VREWIVSGDYGLTQQPNCGQKLEHDLELVTTWATSEPELLQVVGKFATRLNTSRSTFAGKLYRGYKAPNKLSIEHLK
jgi:hypothetical protein